MLEKERQEYKKFKNLEKIILQNSFLNQKQSLKHSEFTHEKYVYIDYSSKDELWRFFWDNVDKNYFLFDQFSFQDLSINLKKQKQIQKLQLLNIIAKQNNKKTKKKKNQKQKQEYLLEVKNYSETSQKLQQNIIAYINFKYYIRINKLTNNKPSNDLAQKQTLHQQINQRRKLRIYKLNEHKKFQQKMFKQKNKFSQYQSKNQTDLKLNKMKKQLQQKQQMIIQFNKFVIEKIQNRFQNVDIVDKNVNKQQLIYIQCCNVINQMQIDLFWHSTISLFNQNIDKKITFELDEFVYNKKVMTIYMNSPFYKKIKLSYKYHQQRILHNGNMFSLHKQKSVFCHFCRMIYHQNQTVQCENNLSSNTSDKINQNNKQIENYYQNYDDVQHGCGRSYCIYCLHNFYGYSGLEENYICPCCKNICNCPRCYIVKNLLKIQKTIDQLKGQQFPQLFFVDSLRLILRKNRKNATLLPQLKRNYNYTQLCLIGQKTISMNNFRQISNQNNIIYLYKQFLKSIVNQLNLLTLFQFNNDLQTQMYFC